MTHAGHEGDRAAPDDEHGRHHDAREEARLDQVVDRIGGAHAQRVDLLGDHHRADLGGDAGADAGREHQRADRRGEIADQELEVRRAEQGEIGDHALGLQARLEDQDHADEAHDHGQEEERAIADLVHLADEHALARCRPCAKK